MGIVAVPAPELSLTTTRANAGRKLLDMTHDLDRCSRGLGRNENREGIFQLLARLKIRDRFPGVRYSNFTRQMALLTDTIARRSGQLRGIHDGTPVPAFLNAAP